MAMMVSSYHKNKQQLSYQAWVAEQDMAMMELSPSPVITEIRSDHVSCQERDAESVNGTQSRYSYKVAEWNKAMTGHMSSYKFAGWDMAMTGHMSSYKVAGWDMAMMGHMSSYKVAGWNMAITRHMSSYKVAGWDTELYKWARVQLDKNRNCGVSGYIDWLLNGTQ